MVTGTVTSETLLTTAEDALASTTPGADAPNVSVIVPVTERADDLEEIYATHAKVLEDAGYTFEFIFVINAGWEQAQRQAELLADRHEHVHLAVFRRNFGESASINYGVRRTTGAIVCTLPAYFQVEPAELVNAIREVEAGTDVVVARRWPRTDPAVNRWQTRAFAWLVSKTARVPLNDVSCGMRAMRRAAAERLPLYGDLHRFIPVLAVRAGFGVKEVDVKQSPKDTGVRVYGIGIYFRRLLDILTLLFITRFTDKPLRFFGIIGGLLFGAGFLVDALLAFQRLVLGIGLANRPMLLLGTLLMVLGIQVISVGLLGEILVYVNARQVKDNVIGLDV